MLRTPAFEEFIAPARRYPSIWRIVLALITAGLIYFVGASAVIIMAIFWMSDTDAKSWGDAFQAAQTDVLGGLEAGADPTLFLVLLATFIPMGFAVVIAGFWHWRGLRSLLGTRVGFISNFIKTGLVIIVIYGLYVGGSLLLRAENYVPNLSLDIWLSYLAFALPLMFIQITSEELFFRGYLQQQLAARFRHAIWWLLLPSILFGLAHFNSELDRNLALTIVLLTGIFGLVAADLTRVTGNLGAAMGLHFANNFFSLFIVGVPDQLSALALYHIPFGMEETDRMQTYLNFDLVLLFVVWVVCRRLLR